MIALLAAVALAAGQPAPRPAAAKPAAPRSALSATQAGDWVVQGKSLSYIFKQRQTVMTGEPVKMTRTDATLTCKKVTLQNDEKDQLQTATCLGDVRFTRSTSVVTCEKATYDQVNSRLTCEGSPVLRDGDRVAEGSLLTYDLVQDVATLKDAIILVPGSSSEDARKALDARRTGGRK
ncbi:MAG: LptA/OstA family protein [Anaeromyxobacter sp.]